MNVLSRAIEAMNEPGNAIIGKMIDKAGASAVIVGGGSAAVDQATETALALPDWAAIVAIVGGLIYIVKLLLEVFIIFAHRNSNDE